MKNVPVKAGPFQLDRYDLKRQNNPVLNDPTGGIMSGLIIVLTNAILSVAPALAGTGLAYGAAVGLAYGGMMAASMGLNMLASGFMSPKVAQTSLSRSPHLINTHDTDEVVMPSYGEFRKGCNWIFADESGGHNKYFNVVLTWADGLCNGLIYTTDYKPNYTGAGKNDMRIKGTFSGAATREFKVQIDGTGSPNTFKWSINDGSSWVATTVSMTGDWQTLQEGVQIKFASTTGHTNANSWTWMAGLGFWVGESLLGLFEAFGASDKDLADHYWHNGSKTQTVDTNLQTECPLYADANARTCYSYLRLKYNIQAFPSGVQDFFALAKWRHLFDPREVAHSATDETTWAYSNNAALVALDWVLRRFGMDRPWARVDETSVEAAANWCDANTMTFNGAILDEQSPEDTLRDIELCYRGFHFERDSKLVFGTLADDTAVMTFTEDDVMIDPEGFVIEIPGMPETPDRVVAWYQEPIENYAAKQVYYPQDSSLSSLTGLNEMELNLIGVTSRTKATQLAKYHYLRAVYNKTYSLTLSPRSYALEPGEMITITHTFPGWSATKVRVLGFGVQQDNGWFTFNVIEENSAIYNTDVNVSDDDIFIEPGIYTYPPDVATGSVKAKSGRIRLTFGKIEDVNIIGLNIYVWTSNTVASSVLMKRIIGQPSSDTIDYGEISEVGSITILSTGVYYFWATAIDENEHESLNKFYLGTTSPLPEPITPSPGDIRFLIHVDGPEPTTSDFTGNVVDAYGASPTTRTGGVIFRPGKFQKGVQIAEAKTNYCTNPQFYSDLTGWGNTGSNAPTSVRDTTQYHIGVASAKVTFGGGNSVFGHNNLANKAAFNGNSISISAWVKASFGQVAFGIQANFTTYSGTTSVVHSGGGEWEYLKMTFIPTFDVGGTTSFIFVVLLGQVLNNIAWIDEVQVEISPYCTPYLDGSLGDGHSWSGTAHASTSTRTVAVLRYNSNMVNAEKGCFMYYWKPSSASQTTHRVFFDLRDNSNPNSLFFYWLFSTGRIEVYVGGVTLVCNAQAFLPDTNYFIRLNYNFTTDIYGVWVNEVQIGNFTNVITQPTNGVALCIGGEFTEAYSINGVLDDFCFVNRELTTDEGSAIYQSNAPIQEITSRLPDRLPPQPDPPTGMANSTPVKQHEDNGTKYQCQIHWSLCIDSSRSRVEYFIEHWTSLSSDSHTYNTHDIQYTLKNLDVNATHYWRVRAEDESKNTTGWCSNQSFAIGLITPIEFLREFNSPWKQKTLAHSKKVTIDSNLSPASGKIWQLLSYHLKAGTGGVSNWIELRINDTVYDTVQSASTPSYVKVSQKYTAGIYLGSSDVIGMFDEGSSTPDAANMFNVAEYDVVDNITLVTAELNLTTYYEVTDGKKFVLTHAYSSFYNSGADVPYYYGPNLDVSFDGGSNWQTVVFHTFTNRETSGDGVYIFPDTAKFRSGTSGGIIHIFGYEMDP